MLKYIIYGIIFSKSNFLEIFPVITNLYIQYDYKDF